ncbi:hypothetical protein F4X73_05870 [Candidatus Poribacteria bacterium]|nr:hypothetical protein [Candidatus Poribacteria bacterium]
MYNYSDVQYEIFELEYSEYGEYEDDRLAIEIAMNVARRLLREPKITPSQIVGIGHALYALQRLPVVTPKVNVRFGVYVRFKTEYPNRDKPEETVTYSDMDYIDFCISQDEFEIARGSSTDTGLGNDSFSLSGWYVGRNGYRETNCELYWIEDHIEMLLKDENTKISVEDNSGIEYFDDEELLSLNYHPLNQKAKELLQQQTDYNLLKRQLYILQLMKFGLESSQMSEKREEIRSTDLMQKLKEKVKSLQKDMTPEQTMSCLIENNNLFTILETDNLTEGTTAALWMVINMILKNLDSPCTDDIS